MEHIGNSLGKDTTYLDINLYQIAFILNFFINLEPENASVLIKKYNIIKGLSLNFHNPNIFDLLINLSQNSRLIRI